jgi:polygalacturonase
MKKYRLFYTLAFIVVANCVSANTYNIAELGAKNDGTTVNTVVIQKAIDRCSASGGGTVLVSGGGAYLTGTIYMKSNVTLRVENGTCLRGSPNIGDYASDTHKNMYKDEPHMNKCLIFARDAESFAFEGHGTIDGNGHRENFSNERPMLLRFVNCRNIHLTDLNLVNPAAWTSAWLYCDNIVVSGIRIHSRANNNGDGLDFDGCTGVRVSNSTFDTSDDCICLQTSLPDRPCRDVTVTNCIFCSQWAGIRIGLLSRGDILSVAVNNCTFRDINDSGLKIQMNEGGELKNMTFSNLVMENVPRPVFMTFCRQRACVDAPPEPAPMKYMGDFIFQNIVVDNSRGDKHSCFVFTGMPDKKINNIVLSNISMTIAGGGTDEDAARDSIPEFDAATLGNWWPEYYLFGTALPASALYARHIGGLVIDNFNVKCLNPDSREVATFVDVIER